MCRNFFDFATCPACPCSQKVAVLLPCYIEPWRERTNQPPFQQAKITSFPPQVYGTRINRNPCKHAVRVPAGISRSGFQFIPTPGLAQGLFSCWAQLPPAVGGRESRQSFPATITSGDIARGRCTHRLLPLVCVLNDHPRAPPMGVPAAYLAETYLITRRRRPPHWGVERIPGLTGTIFVRCVPPPQTFPRTT